MKKDTITITRAEYEHLNKAANAAVEHACELFKAARLVDELQARVAELEAERDTLNRGVQYWQNVANTNDKKAALCWEVEQRCKEQEEAIKELVKGWDEWKVENTELKARIERVRLYGKNIAYTAKYRRNDWAMGEESATNFILSILDGTHKD